MEEVSHLGVVEEPASAADAVRDVRAPEGRLDEGNLRVRPSQHRLRRPRPAGTVVVVHGPSDAVRLVDVGAVADHHRDGAVGPMGLQRMRRRSPSARQHRRGRTQDLRRGPVRVLQRHDLGAGVLFGEVQEVRRIGAVPAVDGLVRVAHHREVGSIAEPRPQQPLLERVDVLVLVDEQVPEPPPLGGGERSGRRRSHRRIAPGGRRSRPRRACACRPRSAGTTRPPARVRPGVGDRPGPMPATYRSGGTRRARAHSISAARSEGETRVVPPRMRPRILPLRSSSVGAAWPDDAQRVRNCA